MKNSQSLQHQSFVFSETMWRGLSTRRGHQRYEKLGEEPAIAVLKHKLPRSTSLPAARASDQSLSISPLPAAEGLVVPGAPFPAKLARKASKSHPLFGLFDGRRRKKTVARPELGRYLEYVKEGGVWDANSGNLVCNAVM